MTPKEHAEIKALAIRIAFELYQTPQLDILLLEAQSIYEFLIKV